MRVTVRESEIGESTRGTLKIKGLIEHLFLGRHPTKGFILYSECDPDAGAICEVSYSIIRPSSDVSYKIEDDESFFCAYQYEVKSLSDVSTYFLYLGLPKLVNKDK